MTTFAQIVMELRIGHVPYATKLALQMTRGQRRVEALTLCRHIAITTGWRKPAEWAADELGLPLKEHESDQCTKVALHGALEALSCIHEMHQA